MPEAKPSALHLGMTAAAAKNIDALLQKSSNVSNGRKHIITALSLLADDQGKRDKVLKGSSGLHSITLNNVNGFRGLYDYDPATGQPVLLGAYEHKEYDRIVNNPQKITILKHSLKTGDFKAVPFDDKTRTFANAYKCADFHDEKTAMLPLAGAGIATTTYNKNFRP